MPTPRQQPDSESSRLSGGIWIFLAVFGAAVLFKIIYLVQYGQRILYARVPLVDAEYYDAWAQRVASGQGYGPSPFYLAPLYPYWLALIYMIAGRDLMLVYALQAVMGIGSLVLVYWIGRKLFGSTAAAVSSILLLLYAPILIIETKLLSESLGILLTLAAMALLLWTLDKPGWGRGLLAGIVLGLSILCRSSNLLFAGVVFLWLAWRWRRKQERHKFVTSGFIALGLAVSILPVTARNYLVGKDTALVQTNFGMTFAQGNNELAVGVFSHPPGTSGGIAIQQSEEMAVAARELGRSLKPSESSSFWVKRTLHWMAQNPAAAARLWGKKLVYSLNDREEMDSYETYYETAKVPTLRLAIVPFSVLFCFALVAIVQSWRSAGVQLLCLYVAGTLLTLLIFYVSSRYRLMAAPMLAILAGYGAVTAWHYLRERRVVPIAAILVALAGTTAVARLPYPMKKSSGTFVLKQLANQYLAAGKLDQGIAILMQASREFPQATELNAELGAALAQRGKYPEAVREYRRALADWSHSPELHVKLANALERMGNTADADLHWLEALRLAPNSAMVLVNRGGSLMNRGRLPEAKDHFERALTADPNSILANNNLGSVLAQSGKPAEAVAYFRKAVELDPTYTRARCNLSRALAETNRSDEAIANLQEGIRVQPDAPALHFDLAQLLVRAGRKDEAIAEYRHVIRLDPKSVPARQQLNALTSAGGGM